MDVDEYFDLLAAKYNFIKRLPALNKEVLEESSAMDVVWDSPNPDLIKSRSFKFGKSKGMYL